MSNTAVCKFCTLQEAAERLNATQGQIEILLQKGVLREYRVGSHRLLRAADVGAIAAARGRRRERQGQPRTSQATCSPSPERDGGPATGPTGAVRVPRSPGAAAQPARRDIARPRTTNGVHQRRELGSRAPARTLPARSAGRMPAEGRRASVRRPAPATPAPRPNLSLREWFWSGLVQDRPEAIILLSGLIVLGLSAVVAGICALAGVL